jgi:hypothetical protein
VVSSDSGWTDHPYVGATEFVTLAVTVIIVVISLLCMTWYDRRGAHFDSEVGEPAEEELAQEGADGGRGSDTISPKWYHLFGGEAPKTKEPAGGSAMDAV